MHFFMGSRRISLELLSLDNLQFCPDYIKNFCPISKALTTITTCLTLYRSSDNVYGCTHHALYHSKTSWLTSTSSGSRSNLTAIITAFLFGLPPGKIPQQQFYITLYTPTNIQILSSIHALLALLVYYSSKIPFLNLALCKWFEE